MESNFEEETLPVKAGDWVESLIGFLRVGKVVRSYWGQDDIGEIVCFIDVCLFDFEGERVGRSSPAMGGTTRYEPSLMYSDWTRIRKPRFPVEVGWIERDDGTVYMGYRTLAERLPDRVAGPKRPRKETAAPKAGNASPNFDPRLEYTSRRMSAQALRDIYKTEKAAGLLAKAEQLDAEADKIFKEWLAGEHG